MIKKTQFYFFLLLILLLSSCSTFSTKELTAYKNNGLPKTKTAVLHNELKYDNYILIHEIDGEPLMQDFGFWQKLTSQYSEVHLTPGVHEVKGRYSRQNTVSSESADFEIRFNFIGGRHYKIAYNLSGDKILFFLQEIEV
jgi:hypothetical protein